MAFTIPMFVGGLAAYVQKKTEKPYFFEQTIGMTAGYGIGLIRILAAHNTYITNRSAATVLVVPAFISGMGWGLGRITGGLVGDARN
jgi:glucose uptake protein GlcU